MSGVRSEANLREWIADHLDPLDESAATPASKPRSYLDLNPDDGTGALDKPPAPASVLVALVERPAGLSVILTKRSDKLRQHTGQIALPGGRRDPGETAAQTALREAHEEIGLHPDFVDPVGLSTPQWTGTGYIITPVIGFVRPGFTLEPNPDEVAEIFETPFGFLMDRSNYKDMQRDLGGGQVRKFYGMTHEDRFIWGATASMLLGLYERLYGAAVA